MEDKANNLLTHANSVLTVFCLRDNVSFQANKFEFYTVDYLPMGGNVLILMNVMKETPVKDKISTVTTPEEGEKVFKLKNSKFKKLKNHGDILVFQL